MIFGSQRKPEAVLLPYAAYEEFVEYRRRRRALDMADGSLRAEGLTPTAETVERAERWAGGEISGTDMCEETLRHYRRL
ncbi:MAG: antitoxin VbhA family protein [Actinoallomurus sp.]